MPSPAIELRDVSKRFGAVRSLDGLSLAIEPGSVFGYLGPNGAGKTTTLRVLLGLVRLMRPRPPLRKSWMRIVRRLVAVDDPPAAQAAAAPADLGEERARRSGEHASSL